MLKRVRFFLNLIFIKDLETKLVKLCIKDALDEDNYFCVLWPLP